MSETPKEAGNNSSNQSAAAAAGDSQAEARPQPAAESDPSTRTGSGLATSSVDRPRKRPIWKRLLRRWKLLLVIFCVLMLGFRGVLAWRLPALVDGIAADYGLHARWERLDLALLALDVELWHFEVTPRETEAPLFYVEYLRGDVSVWDLLRGRLTITRAEGDGVEIHLRRDASGEFPDLATVLSEVQKKSSQQQAPSTEAPTTVPETHRGAPAEFALPLTLQALRLQHVQFFFRDEGLDPPFETELHGNLRLSNLNHPTRPVRFEWEQWLDGYLDRLTVRADAKLKPQELVVNFDLDLAGLTPAGLLQYVTREEMPFQEWNGKGAGELKLTTAPGQPLAASLRVTEVLLSEIAGSRLGLDRMTARASWGDDGLALGECRLSGLSIDGVLTQAPLDFDIEELSLSPAADPGNASVALRGVGRWGGLVDRWQVEGNYRLQPAQVELNLRGALDGLQQSWIEPLIAGGGLQCDWEGCRAAGDWQLLVGWGGDGIHVDSSLNQLSLQQGERVLASVETLALDGLHWSNSNDSPRLVIDAIRQQGAHLQLRRDSQRNLHFLGWTLTSAPGTADEVAIGAAAGSSEGTGGKSGAPNAGVSADRSVATTATSLDNGGVTANSHSGSSTTTATTTTATTATATTTTDSSTTAAAPAPLVFLLNRLAGDVTLEIEDQVVGENFESLQLSFAASDIGRGHQSPIEFGIDGARWGNLKSTGRLRVGDSGAMYTAHNELGALAMAELAKLYAPPQLECNAEQLRGAFDLAAGFEWGALPRVVVNVFDANLNTIDQEWLRWRDLELDVELGQSAPVVRMVWVEPTITLVEGESLEFLGCRWLSPSSPGAAGVADPTAEQPSLAVKDIWASLVMPPLHEILAEPIVVLRSSSIEGGKLQLLDPKSARPRVWQYAVKMDDVAVGGENSGSWSVVAELPDTSEGVESAGSGLRLAVGGELSLTASRQQLTGELLLEGVQQQRLGAWLPRGIEVTLNDGRCLGKLDLAATPHADGGVSLRVGLHQVSITDNTAAGDTTPLSFDTLDIDVARLDGAARTLIVDSLKFTGLKQSLRQDARGVEIAGFRFLHSEPPAPTSSVTSPDDSAGTATPGVVSTPSGGIQHSLPDVRLNELLVDIERVTFEQVGDVPKSLELAQLRIALDHPWRIDEVLPADAPEHRLEGRITAQVPTVLDRFECRWGVAPQQQPLGWHLGLDLDGIDIEPLLPWLPADVATQLQVEKLAGGSFVASVEGSVEPAQRGPLQWDFSRPLPFEVRVHDVHLRDASSRSLVGVEEIRVEGGRWDGKRSALRIGAIEVVRPQLELTTAKDSIEVLGCRIALTPPPAKTPTAAAIDSAADSATVVAKDAATVSSPPSPSGSPPSSKRPTPSPLQLDLRRLQVAELDLAWTDNSLTEPRTLLLDQLDVLVQEFRYSSAAVTPPFRVSFFLAAAEMALPPDGEVRSPLAAATLNGRVQLKPLQASVQGRLEGFEIVTVEGLARQVGVELYDGVIDGRVDLELGADGSLSTNSAFVFTDLDVQEGEAGLLRKLLKLPTPVQAVVAAIRDHDGAISIPLKVKLGPDTGWAQFGPVAINAVSGVMLDALAAAPLRLGNSLIDLTGLGGAEAATPIVHSIEFEPAASVWTEESVGAATVEIAGIVAQLREDEQMIVQLVHQWGERDLELARARLATDPKTALRWAERGRRQKQVLEQQRKKHLRGLEAVLESGFPSEVVEWRQTAQRWDAQLAGIERSLDELFDWIDGRSRRWLERRLREDAILLGERRLSALRQRFLELGVAPTRIESRSASAREPQGKVGAVQLLLRARRVE